MHHISIDEALKAIKLMLKESEYCFFITHAPGGRIHARLMQHFTPEPDLTLWFGAGPGSRKVQEVKENMDVTVSTMHPQHGGYVTFIGKAEVVTETSLKQKYWRAHWSDIYPGGPENEEYLLLKFTPERLEWMDFADQDLPAPYGLKPMGLEKSDGNWVMTRDRSSL